MNQATSGIRVVSAFGLEEVRRGFCNSAAFRFDFSVQG